MPTSSCARQSRRECTTYQSRCALTSILITSCAESQPRKRETSQSLLVAFARLVSTSASYRCISIGTQAAVPDADCNEERTHRRLYLRPLGGQAVNLGLRFDASVGMWRKGEQMASSKWNFQIQARFAHQRYCHRRRARGGGAVDPERAAMGLHCRGWTSPSVVRARSKQR